MFRRPLPHEQGVPLKRHRPDGYISIKPIAVESKRCFILERTTGDIRYMFMEFFDAATALMLGLTCKTMLMALRRCIGDSRVTLKAVIESCVNGERGNEPILCYLLQELGRGSYAHEKPVLEHITLRVQQMAAKHDMRVFFSHLLSLRFEFDHAEVITSAMRSGATSVLSLLRMHHIFKLSESGYYAQCAARSYETTSWLLSHTRLRSDTLGCMIQFADWDTTKLLVKHGATLGPGPGYDLYHATEAFRRHCDRGVEAIKEFRKCVSGVDQLYEIICRANQPTLIDAFIELELQPSSHQFTCYIRKPNSVQTASLLKYQPLATLVKLLRWAYVETATEAFAGIYGLIAQRKLDSPISMAKWPGERRMNGGDRKGFTELRLLIGQLEHAIGGDVLTDKDAELPESSDEESEEDDDDSESSGSYTRGETPDSSSSSTSSDHGRQVIDTSSSSESDKDEV